MSKINIQIQAPDKIKFVFEKIDTFSPIGFTNLRKLFAFQALPAAHESGIMRNYRKYQLNNAMPFCKIKLISIRLRQKEIPIRTIKKKVGLHQKNKIHRQELLVLLAQFLQL